MKRQVFAVAGRPDFGNRPADIAKTNKLHGEQLHLLRQGLKRCKGCNQAKPTDSFYRAEGVKSAHGYKDGLTIRCRDCMGVHQKNFYATGRRDAARVKRMFGITLEERENKRQDQGCGCAICKKPVAFNRTYSGAHTDHCHTTNKFRGVLCFDCNVGLGKFNDDASRLLMAVFYLREFYEDNPDLQEQLKDQQSVVFSG